MEKRKVGATATTWLSLVQLGNDNNRYNIVTHCTMFVRYCVVILLDIDLFSFCWLQVCFNKFSVYVI